MDCFTTTPIPINNENREETSVLPTPISNSQPSTSCFDNDSGVTENIRHDSGDIVGEESATISAPRITSMKTLKVPMVVLRKTDFASKTRNKEYIKKEGHTVVRYENSSSPFEREEKSNPGGGIKRLALEDNQEEGKLKSRGRPTKTGEFVGLAKAKRELAQAEELLLQKIAEKEFIEVERERRITREAWAMNSQIGELSADPLESERATRISTLRVLTDGAETIRNVVKRSKNLKGTFQRSMKETAEAIEIASRKLASLSASSEVLELEKENKALRAEVGSLRKEM